MSVTLVASHWIYLAGLVVILTAMGLKKNPILPAVVLTGIVTWSFTGSPINALTAIFNGTLAAATELFSIVLIIALITAMLHALQQLGADSLMVRPLAHAIRSGPMAFVVLAVATYLLSLFFWPTPAVPLIAAVLIPAAIAAGMRPIAVGMVIGIAGQGMALSSDYIIKVAPSISATASGGNVEEIADKALVLSLVVGVVAFAITFCMEFRHFRKPTWLPAAPADTPGPDGGGAAPSGGSSVAAVTEAAPQVSSPVRARCLAIAAPLAFGALVAYMIASKVSDTIPDLKGGQAAALVGGIALLLCFAAAVVRDPRESLSNAADSVVHGFGFAMKVMAIVFPIAGFFFLGNPEFAGQIMGLDDPKAGPGFLFDLVSAVQPAIPDNSVLLVLGVLLAGMIGGLDGAGFSVLPLTGSLSGAFGGPGTVDTDTLAAVGQMGAIWVGGGTLAAWSSIVAVAAFSGVSPVELTRRCVVPVISGLVVAAGVAILFL